MKNTCLFCLFFLFISNGYSQNLSFLPGKYVDMNDQLAFDSGSGNYHFFRFSDNFRVEGYKNGNKNGGHYKGSYTITEDQGINYLEITWDDKTTDKYLVIGYVGESGIRKGKFIFYPYFYNADGAPFFSGGTIPSESYITYFPDEIETKILSSSSALREGNIVYSVNNLNSRIGVCWAEGVNGQGIGEKIIFSAKEDGPYVSFSELYISTGFVSYQKPYLYRENSRPKKIRVSFENENPRIIELADTPNLQYIGIHWSNRYDKKDLWIEILEVYPGTKYTDTCINFFQTKQTN